MTFLATCAAAVAHEPLAGIGDGLIFAKCGVELDKKPCSPPLPQQSRSDALAGAQTGVGTKGLLSAGKVFNALPAMGSNRPSRCATAAMPCHRQ